MSFTWPATLPNPEIDMEETAPNLVVRTDMDAGPPKVRRRHTSGVRPWRKRVVLTLAQVETFDEFFVDTLSGGASRFDFTNSRTGVSCEFRFVEPPVYRRLGPDAYEVAMSWEQMP